MSQWLTGIANCLRLPVHFQVFGMLAVVIYLKKVEVAEVDASVRCTGQFFCLTVVGREGALACPYIDCLPVGLKSAFCCFLVPACLTVASTE